MYPVILTVVFAIIAVVVFVVLHRVIKRTFGAPSEWEENNEPHAIKMVVEDINRAKERILLFGGQGDTYNDESILEALEKKDIPIKMIFENPEIGVTRLHDVVAKKRNIFLGFIATPDYNHRHFRVVDYDYVYIEKRHDPGSKNRFYRRLFNGRFLPAKYSKEFYSIKTQATDCEMAY
jgi:hypothetical protein